MEKNLVYVVERRDRANPVGLQLIQPLGIRVFLIDRRKFFSRTSYAGKLLTLVTGIQLIDTFDIYYLFFFTSYTIYYNLNTSLKYTLLSVISFQ